MYKLNNVDYNVILVEESFTENCYSNRQVKNIYQEENLDLIKYFQKELRPQVSLPSQ